MEKYVAIIEAGGANFSSVKNALDRLNIKYIVTSDPNKIANSYKVILPGVGNAKYSMQCIKDLKLYDVIKSLKQPTLGICLGMQLLCRSSEEGNIECLNIIPLDVCLLKDIKIIPEMGWNNFESIKLNRYTVGVNKLDDFYYVHSYAANTNNINSIGITKYGINFSSIVSKNNFIGFQFHPEKSGIIGSKLLSNFLCVRNLDIIPSIDIKNGKCVRLTQGDFNQQKNYDVNPIDIVNKYQNAGVKTIHVVDLDGASNKIITQLNVIDSIRKNFSGILQVGGGVRSKEDVEKLFNIGVDRVVIGSICINDQKLTQYLLDTYGGNKIVLALDFRKINNDYIVTTNGWVDNSTLSITDVLKKYKGIEYVLSTDISKDGMLEGTNIEFYTKISKQFPDIKFIASGGISNYNDINELENNNIYGCVIGKALFENKVKIEEVIKW